MQKISLIQNKTFRKFIKILIWTIAVFMLLCLLFNTYKYFEQVSFWQEKLELYEIEDVSAYDIVNTAYKGFFGKNHFIKIKDGIYMDIQSSLFKKFSYKDGFYKMIPEIEKQVNKDNYFYKLITASENKDEEYIEQLWYSVYKHRYIFDKVILTDGVEGQVKLHLSKMYFLPFPVVKKFGRESCLKTCDLYYYVFFVKENLYDIAK